MGNDDLALLESWTPNGPKLHLGIREVDPQDEAIHRRPNEKERMKSLCQNDQFGRTKKCAIRGRCAHHVDALRPVLGGQCLRVWS